MPYTFILVVDFHLTLAKATSLEEGKQILALTKAQDPDPQISAEGKKFIADDITCQKVFHDTVITAINNGHKVAVASFGDKKIIKGYLKIIFANEIAKNSNFLKQIIIAHEDDDGLDNKNSRLKKILDIVNSRREKTQPKFKRHQMIFCDDESKNILYAWLFGAKALHVTPQMPLEKHLTAIEPLLTNTNNMRPPIAALAQEFSTSLFEPNQEPLKMLFASGNNHYTRTFLYEYSECLSDEIKAFFLAVAIDAKQINILKYLVEQPEFDLAWHTTISYKNQHNQSCTANPLKRLFCFYKAEYPTDKKLESKNILVTMLTKLNINIKEEILYFIAEHADPNNQDDQNILDILNSPQVSLSPSVRLFTKHVPLLEETQSSVVQLIPSTPKIYRSVQKVSSQLHGLLTNTQDPLAQPALSIPEIHSSIQRLSPQLQDLLNPAKTISRPVTPIINTTQNPASYWQTANQQIQLPNTSARQSPVITHNAPSESGKRQTKDEGKNPEEQQTKMRKENPKDDPTSEKQYRL